MSATTTTTMTVRIGDYLAERLYDQGVRHVFTGPDPALTALAEHCESAGISVVTLGDSQAAAFAADAYARMRGVGVVLASYGAPALNTLTPIAQAFVERSPLLLISSLPPTRDHANHPLLAATSTPAMGEVLAPNGATSLQSRAFAPLAMTATLDAPDIACREIERALGLALTHKRPVYLELSDDILGAEAVPMPAPRVGAPTSDPSALAAAIAEATAMLRSAERPVLILGVEVQRFGLQDTVLRLMSATNIPTAVTLLGKSVIGEHAPGFLGVYAGAMGERAVRAAVDASDRVILIGARGFDLDPGGQRPALDPSRCIDATADAIRIGHHRYDAVMFADFVAGLTAADLPRFEPEAATGATVPVPPIRDPAGPLDRASLFRVLTAAMTDETVVIADPGEALMAVADIPIELCSEFMSPASFGSRGFAIPASIGVGLAEPELRTLVVVESSAIARTGLELATAVRLGLGPVVVVLSNLPDASGSVSWPTTGWDLSRLTPLIGGGWSATLSTAGDLARALSAAADRPGELALLDVRLGNW